MQNKTVLKKNSDMVTRVIDDETILLPIYKSSDDISCIFSLNKVASRVWEVIDGKRTVAQIKTKLLKEFDATPEEMNKELQTFVKELKEIKAVK
ncbi:MAG: PqqD family protein [Candidatus Omnitrophica bacterium]|nr:PqqD family protein [Candidatus Omnitrophota bacterium]